MSCVTCYIPKYFDFDEKKCVNCPANMVYDINLRQCVDCPPNTPYFDGSKCSLCPSPMYWNE